MSNSETDTPIVTTPTRARGAVRGQGVSMVLIVSTLGVVILFGALWMYFFA